MSYSKALALSAVFAGVASSASAADFGCPAWHGGARLADYSVFDGKPSLLIEQIPDLPEGKGDAWDVRRSTSNQPDGYHLVCGYKQAGKLDLVIPANISRCIPGGSALSPTIACR